MARDTQAALDELRGIHPAGLAKAGWTVEAGETPGRFRIVVQSKDGGTIVGHDRLFEDIKAGLDAFKGEDTRYARQLGSGREMAGERKDEFWKGVEALRAKLGRERTPNQASTRNLSAVRQEFDQSGIAFSIVPGDHPDGRKYRLNIKGGNPDTEIVVGNFRDAVVTGRSMATQLYNMRHAEFEAIRERANALGYIVKKGESIWEDEWPRHNHRVSILERGTYSHKELVTADAGAIREWLGTAEKERGIAPDAPAPGKSFGSVKEVKDGFERSKDSGPAPGNAYGR